MLIMLAEVSSNDGARFVQTPADHGNKHNYIIEYTFIAVGYCFPCHVYSHYEINT